MRRRPFEPHAVRESVAFDSIYELGDEVGERYSCENDLSLSMAFLQLGRAMSVMRVRRDDDGIRLATKYTGSLNLEDEEALMQEVNIAAPRPSQHRPNYGFFDEPTMFYLVMDLIEGGELLIGSSERILFGKGSA